MWIGAIRLHVRTMNLPNAGTDNLVTATLLRDGVQLGTLKLDYPTENDLERGALRSYDYIGPTKLPRRNDQTPELPPGQGKHPMPCPEYGFEFSNGLKHHLTLRFKIHGADQWISDYVGLYVKEIRLPDQFPNTTDEWTVDTGWKFVTMWLQLLLMSSDSSEGAEIKDLTYSN